MQADLLIITAHKTAILNLICVQCKLVVKNMKYVYFYQIPKLQKQDNNFFIIMEPNISINMQKDDFNYILLI